jgi:hypothetical protein
MITDSKEEYNLCVKSKILLYSSQGFLIMQQRTSQFRAVVCYGGFLQGFHPLSCTCDYAKYKATTTTTTTHTPNVNYIKTFTATPTTNITTASSSASIQPTAQWHHFGRWRLHVCG